MTTSSTLLRRRRFLPLFITQLLNAFNDNLYKNAMVLFVVYSVYSSEAEEARFSAIASGLFILPFFLLSSLAGQLADMRDKARIIRAVKLAEIFIMLCGAAGLLLAWQGQLTTEIAIPLMLAALLAMGVHSTFFGPIKYAILPQHLKKHEVLSGTGLVEAGTYIAILSGTILAGWLAVEWAAAAVLITAIVGYAASRHVPPAPPLVEAVPIDHHVLRSSIALIRNTMKDREVYYAILAISFFWTIGTVLFIQFPPLAKNVLMASKEVASLFLVTFSVGVAIGSIAINALLRGKVSARFGPAAVCMMGVFVACFHLVCRYWDISDISELMGPAEFIARPLALPLLLSLLAIAVAGGMFVVPLYAFLTTRVDPSQAARTIAANNIVNAGAMVTGALIAAGLSATGVSITDQVLLSAAMCALSAWFGYILVKAEKAAELARTQV